MNRHSLADSRRAGSSKAGQFGTQTAQVFPDTAAVADGHCGGVGLVMTRASSAAIVSSLMGRGRNASSDAFNRKISGSGSGKGIWWRHARLMGERGNAARASGAEITDPVYVLARRLRVSYATGASHMHPAEGPSLLFLGRSASK